MPFEPGSVFKVITLSAALETTNLRPESLIDCHGGVLTLSGRIIHDSHTGMGVIPMATVLAKSSNIGAIEVGMQVGQEQHVRLRDAVRLRAEDGIAAARRIAAARCASLSSWGTTSLASVSMGQEVSVTTLQLAQAASVIANGGLLVQAAPGAEEGRPRRARAGAGPHHQAGDRHHHAADDGRRGSARRHRQPQARLAGYSVGGKTGSAQIFDFATKHYTHTYNGSFMGFAPLTNPAIVVVVTLNGTHGDSGFGGQAAAPVFHAVATEALRVLDVPKDLPEHVTPTLVAKNPEDQRSGHADRSPPANILEEIDETEAAPHAAVYGPHPGRTRADGRPADAAEHLPRRQRT